MTVCFGIINSVVAPHHHHESHWFDAVCNPATCPQARCRVLGLRLGFHAIITTTTTKLVPKKGTEPPVAQLVSYSGVDPVFANMQLGQAPAPSP